MENCNETCGKTVGVRTNELRRFKNVNSELNFNPKSEKKLEIKNYTYWKRICKIMQKCCLKTIPNLIIIIKIYEILLITFLKHANTFSSKKNVIVQWTWLIWNNLKFSKRTFNFKIEFAKNVTKLNLQKKYLTKL